MANQRASKSKESKKISEGLSQAMEALPSNPFFYVEKETGKFFSDEYRAEKNFGKGKYEAVANPNHAKATTTKKK